MSRPPLARMASAVVALVLSARAVGAQSRVTFAPEGAYGHAGVKSVFTHGLAIGLARNDKRDLRIEILDCNAACVTEQTCPNCLAYRGVQRNRAW